jgi:hypothetical protein
MGGATDAMKTANSPTVEARCAGGNFIDNISIIVGSWANLRLQVIPAAVGAEDISRQLRQPCREMGHTPSQLLGCFP